MISVRPDGDCALLLLFVPKKKGSKALFPKNMKDSSVKLYILLDNEDFKIHAETRISDDNASFVFGRIPRDILLKAKSNYRITFAFVISSKYSVMVKYPLDGYNKAFDYAIKLYKKHINN